MNILKIDQDYNSYLYTASLATVDTEVSIHTDLESTLISLKSLLEDNFSILPADISINHALAFFYQDKEQMYYLSTDQKEWLSSHSTQNVVLDVQRVWANTSTRTWFVNVWIIPNTLELFNNK